MTWYYCCNKYSGNCIIVCQYSGCILLYRPNLEFKLAELHSLSMNALLMSDVSQFWDPVIYRNIQTRNKTNLNYGAPL